MIARRHRAVGWPAGRQGHRRSSAKSRKPKGDGVAETLTGFRSRRGGRNAAHR